MSSRANQEKFLFDIYRQLREDGEDNVEKIISKLNEKIKASGNINIDYDNFKDFLLKVVGESIDNSKVLSVLNEIKEDMRNIIDAPLGKTFQEMYDEEYGEGG